MMFHSKLQEEVKLTFFYTFVLFYFIIKVFVFLPNLVVRPDDPFVSGDFFRSIANYVIYTEKQAQQLMNVSPESLYHTSLIHTCVISHASIYCSDLFLNRALCLPIDSNKKEFTINFSFQIYRIENGSIIFIHTPLLYALGEFQKRNRNFYILITHDSIVPAPGIFQHFLNDPYLIRWFGQNIDFRHPKLEGLPLGIANAHWVHGNQDRLLQIREERKNSSERFDGLFVGYMAATDATRKRVKDHFCSQNHNWTYCIKTRTSVEDYLRKIGTMQFVLSPRGKGLDCHRTWESIAMGAIPVVETSTLDDMLMTERVLIVPSLLNVTEQTLKDTITEFGKNPRSNLKIYRTFWRERISRFQFLS